MKHPMYKDLLASEILEVAKVLKDSDIKDNDSNIKILEKLQEKVPNHYLDSTVYLPMYYICKKINDTGNIIIDAQNEDWDNDLSLKALLNVNLQDFHFPILHGAIETKLKRYYFHINKEEHLFLLIVYSKNEKCIYNFAFEFHEINEEIYKNIGIEFFSIMMYVSIFKDNKERIISKVISTKKKLKKRKNNSINIIKLKQSTQTSYYSEKNTRENSTKRWIVRGHWRLQNYKNHIKKLIWIEPFWKGVGSEVVNKLYKVSE